MLRLGIMSDLHLELDRKCEPVDVFRFSAPDMHLAASPGPSLDLLLNEPVDMVIMAGDVDARTKGIGYAHVLSGLLNAPVVYVAGNHEFYDDTLSLVARLERSAEQSDGVVFLEKRRADFAFGDRKVAILGTTLWTDFEVTGDRNAAIRAAEAAMNDYRCIGIENTTRRIAPQDTIALHQAARSWLIDQLEQIGSDSDVIVVTHHAPSLKSLAPSGVRGAFPGAYASNLEALIAKYRPKLWVHGHTHWPTDYRLHATRVVCHALGYPHARAATGPLVIDF